MPSKKSQMTQSVCNCMTAFRKKDCGILRLRQHSPITLSLNSTTFCINFHFFGGGQSIQLSALLHDIRLKKFKGIQTK